MLCARMCSFVILRFSPLWISDGQELEAQISFKRVLCRRQISGEFELGEISCNIGAAACLLSLTEVHSSF